MKIINKVLVIIILAITIFTIIGPTYVSADPISNPNDYFGPNWKSSSTKFRQKAEVILGIIRALGTIISVVAFLVMGVKYIMGSVDEKVEYKERMIPYLIGFVMLFAISNIVGIIYDLTKDATADIMQI